MTSSGLVRSTAFAVGVNSPVYDDARRGSVLFADELVRVVVHGARGEELVLHALDLGNHLVVPRGPLDLGHRVRAEPLRHFGGPSVDTELQVRLAPRQELRCQRFLREVGEAKVGAVGPVVVGELGAGIDVDLLANVEAGLGVGDGIVDPGELGIVDEIDAEHQHEVVGHDTLFEVGAGLADLQELVELRVVRRVCRWV